MDRGDVFQITGRQDSSRFRSRGQSPAGEEGEEPSRMAT